ncbi:M28 family metallopeptidase [Methanobacterium oryzae]|uniref:M28 family metallopeptidase n=1 Tax=Methanobacterium oryzae TaxID=69540 RepID=UPI003D1D4459
MHVKTLFLFLILLFSIFPANLEPIFASEDLLIHVRHISKDIGPRQGGSKEEEMTAQYIASQFRKNGIKTEIQKFKYYSLNSEGIKTSQNVVGTIEGISDKEIIICADLDTVKDFASANYTEGANDDATGLAVLIGLAEKYKCKKPLFTIKLIACGASEDGFTFPLVTPKRTELSADSYYKINYIPYMVGARQYVLSNQQNLNKTLAVLSIEAVGIGNPYFVSRDYYTENDPFFINFLVLNAKMHGIGAEKIDFMASKLPLGQEAAISHIYLPFSIAKIPSTFITCMNNPDNSGIHDTTNCMPNYLSVDDTYENLVKENMNEELLREHLEDVLDMVDASINGISYLNSWQLF